MKEELIGIELAKLATETFGEVYLKDVRTYFEKESIEECELPYHTFCYKDVFNNGVTPLIRPSQSLLQRYIREKYNIHVEVNIVLDFQNEHLFKYDICDTSKFSKGISVEPEFKTHEQALEQGLKQAIEIIKNEEKEVRKI